MNSVNLIGRLTRDPNAKETSNGVSCSLFSLAVNRPGAKQADFVDVVAYRHTADFVNKYLTKGRLVAVTGRLNVRNWTDAQGEKRHTVQVIADSVQALDRPGAAQPADDDPFEGE